MDSRRSILHQIKQLNFFLDAKTKQEGNPQVLRDQILSTRVYICLMIVGTLILAVLAFFTPRVISVTVEKPSINQYYDLEARYSTTLACPCENTAVPFGSFLSITPVYHQVCSSDFVSSNWLASLFKQEALYFTPLDFRATALPQFRLLWVICSMTAMSIDNVQTGFAAERLVNTRALSPASFTEQAKALLRKFLAAISLKLTAYIGAQLIATIIGTAPVYSVAYTNQYARSIPGSNEYTISWNCYPLHDNVNSTSDVDRDFLCCDKFESTTYKAGIYTWAAEPRPFIQTMIPQPPPIYVVPGMRVGCLPFHSLIASTLECFYDEVCLNVTARWISTLSPTAWPRPLNSSLSSRFKPNTSISYIMSEQMVEKWTNVTNFTGYYQACSPIECTYTIIKRSELLYVLTTLIGSFGGLMVVLRIVSPLIIRLFRSMANFHSEKNRQNTISQTPQPGISETLLSRADRERENE